VTERYADIVSSIFCCGVGILFCVGSTRFGDIRSGFPSAGFFPFMGGVILVALSLIQVGSSVFKKELARKPANFFPQRDSFKNLLITLCVLFAYGIVLMYLGFCVTTCLFMICLLQLKETQRWTTVIISAILTSIASYVLFEIFLKVQLPTGLVGI
jgi:putative tricarboxylic transport membrane protein